MFPIIQTGRVRVTELHPTGKNRAATTDLLKHGGTINKVESIPEINQQHRKPHITTTSLNEPVQGMQDSLSSTGHPYPKLKTSKIRSQSRANQTSTNLRDKPSPDCANSNRTNTTPGFNQRCERSTSNVLTKSKGTSALQKKINHPRNRG